MTRALHIRNCKLTLGDERAELKVDIVLSDGSQRQVWYSIPSERSSWFVKDRYDGFVVALILPAMWRGENIHVDGPLSERLWHALQRLYIPLISHVFGLRPIRISADLLTAARSCGTGIATGFSAGIDSFATLVRHLRDEELPSYRVSHLLFHNVGSHGDNFGPLNPERAERARILFRQRLARLAPVTEAIGLPLIPVDSNIAEVIPVDFLRMHHALNASVPLLLQNGLRQYLYASTYKYSDCGVQFSDDIGRLDPIAFHLFSTESINCASTGCEMSRIQKTELVASYAPSYEYLNVCVDESFQGENCSQCFKCCRTLLTMELLGVLEKYQNAFNLKRFTAVRRRYLQAVITHKPHSFEAEICQVLYAQRPVYWKHTMRGVRFFNQLWR